MPSHKMKFQRNCSLTLILRSALRKQNVHIKEVYLPKRYSRLLIEETLRTRNTIIMFLCVGAVSQNFLLSMFFLYIDIYFA